MEKNEILEAMIMILLILFLLVMIYLQTQNGITPVRDPYKELAEIVWNQL